MSKKKKSSSSAVPAPPPPQNEYFYEDDYLRSQRVYDPAKQAYVTQSFSTPDEQAIDKTATGFISDLTGQVKDKFNMSPEQIAQYREAYAAPQRQALNESYNKSLGQANMAGSSSGMRNSVGFNKYLSNELERNRAQGLADIESNAKMMEYDIPRKMLAPYADAFNLVNAALSGEQARSMSSVEPAFQGSQAANNFALQNYNNQLGYYQMKNQPKQSGGGFFSKLLFGGF